ncbi:MAG TPA: PAS domain S-box protein [Pyrinomonadaceae bacterium]|nr:PAS domain S-box protein [Pyrinomonadaceae bacterium]
MDKEPALNEFFLGQMLNASTEGILAFDRECRYIAWNAAMESISGIRKEDVLGKCAFDVFPFLKQTREDKHFYAALQGFTATSHNTRYIVPQTGRQGFYKGHYSPLRNEQNEIIGGVAIIQDITERKHAEAAAQQAHKRLTFHVENSPLAVIEWDSDARVSRWSESAERLFGWKAEEVLGKHVSDWHFVFDEDVDAVAQVTHRQRVGAELHGVQRNRNYTRDGSVLFCEWYNSVLHDGNGKMVSILSLVLDVTTRKAADEERTALLTRERELRERAEESDRLKDEFLATLSHELRTPLTAILGWAMLIRSGDLDPENLPNAIQIIERNAKSQARLIEDLLDVSRIIQGNLKLEVHPLNLGPLVETTNEALKPAATAKGIQVELEIDAGTCIVSGDPTRLRQVVWNLLMNAIKFTPRGGKVNVTLKCISEPDESSLLDSLSGRLADSRLPCVRLTVTDNGEGIKPEFLPYIFHRFRQEESSISRKAGGLGLGLAVVRHLVELHGGTVSARSAGRGLGSAFIVELPLVHSTRETTEPGEPLQEFITEDSAAAESPKVAGLYGVRVLLVEDDDDSRTLLEVLLKRQQAEVVAVASAAEALDVLVQCLKSNVPGQEDKPAQHSAPSTQHSFSDTQPLTSDLLHQTSKSNVADQSEIRNPKSEIPLPDIIISDLGMPGEDGYQLLRKIRSLASDVALSPQHSALSTQHSALLSAAAIPAIALTGYATAKDRERALAAGYQLHLAKPVEPEELVNAIVSVLSGQHTLQSRES